ncbi:2-hydroxyacid dehydrogenase [Cohaesibacter intestini]|uniref:2-hydroxyacid dehydrogenase n=1 Tax=Cohaesibacter intestini TaxID=2211145 RepID=UPI000DE97DCE|nr:glyoxylate/hydroxypyruvate reductase A [Cohaesibacter intestini]
MNILLYANGWDMDAWATRIRKELPHATIITPDTLTNPASVDYAMVWKPEPGYLAGFPNLKVICSLGAGVDFLMADPDLPDLPVVRVIDPDLTGRMSEYVLLQCLLHHRRTLSYLRYQAAGIWKDQADVAAREIRVGVLGLGILGLDAARKLQMVGYDVAGWSRSPKSIDGLRTFAGAEGLDAMAARTDILVSLLPHTPQTEGMLNLTLFRKLAQDGPLGGPVVINAGRGKLQVERDIMEALDEGSLIGASLDVFEEEPLRDGSPIWSHPSIILTPHNAAVSDPIATTAYLARQLTLFEAGEPMESVVDRNAGY